MKRLPTLEEPSTELVLQLLEAAKYYYPESAWDPVEIHDTDLRFFGVLLPVRVQRQPNLLPCGLAATTLLAVTFAPLVDQTGRPTRLVIKFLVTDRCCTPYKIDLGTDFLSFETNLYDLDKWLGYNFAIPNQVTANFRAMCKIADTVLRNTIVVRATRQ